MSYAIQVENLKESYGNTTILKGFNFNVAKEEIFGILGINGTGKTTILECIEGLRKYERGKISIKGEVGIQLQCASLPAYIKPLEAIQLFAKWKKVKVDSYVLSSLEINDLIKKHYIELSTGQKRRYT